MYVDVFNVFRHGRPRIKNLFAPQFHQRKPSFKKDSNITLPVYIIQIKLSAIFNIAHESVI